MADTNSGSRVNITQLIMVPALISLAITVLRLIGELQHWSPRLFSRAAGGGGALIGISWLPVLFGPYFALKLAGSGEGPERIGKAFGWTALGLGVYVLGTFLFASTVTHPSILTLVGFLITLAAAFVSRPGWRALGNTLLAYAFAARIPVLVVMFLAIRGNGGQGWGTHYDVPPPNFPPMGVWGKFLTIAVLPQMTLWIGFTVIVGSLVGITVAAIARRTPQTP